jgi:phospholipid transport system substrate-binding protein
MISRRTLLSLSMAALVAPAQAAAHPSIVFMNQMGKDLLHAHRIGTVSAFLRVIQRYADVNGISDYSLGTYKVNGKQRVSYVRGVAIFMSRYFAEQSRNYPVAKYEIGEATVDDNKDVLVDTKITMMSGQTYSVNWRLNWVYQQRSIFTAFVGKNNGDVGKLIIALNR